MQTIPTTFTIQTSLTIQIFSTIQTLIRAVSQFLRCFSLFVYEKCQIFLFLSPALQSACQTENLILLLRIYIHFLNKFYPSKPIPLLNLRQSTPIFRSCPIIQGVPEKSVFLQNLYLITI